MVCGAFRECISIFELGIVQEASHVCRKAVGQALSLRHMQSGFEGVAGWESDDGIGAKRQSIPINEKMWFAVLYTLEAWRS